MTRVVDTKIDCNLRVVSTHPSSVGNKMERASWLISIITTFNDETIQSAGAYTLFNR